MITIREAIQRLCQYNIKLERYGSLQWRLSYREDTHHGHSRLVDGLEDALIVSADMRFQRSQEPIVRAMPSTYIPPQVKRAMRSQFVANQLARLEVLRAI